jgi:hypothetical protein
MDVSAEAPQFDLLALARFDRQGVGIYPLVRGDISRFRSVGKDIEDCRLIDDRQEGHSRHDLFQNISYLCLNL